MPTIPLRERPSWKALEQHHAEIGGRHLRDLFAAEPGRGERLSAEAAGLYLDYSKNRVTDETLRAAARARPRVRAGAADRDMMFARRADQHLGAPVGAARRAADARGSSLIVDGTDVVAQVHEVLGPDGGLRRAGQVGRVAAASPASRSRNIVNIGIGGSDLGPVMAYEALRFYSRSAT